MDLERGAQIFSKLTLETFDFASNEKKVGWTSRLRDCIGYLYATVEWSLDHRALGGWTRIQKLSAIDKASDVNFVDSSAKTWLCGACDTVTSAMGWYIVHKAEAFGCS